MDRSRTDIHTRPDRTGPTDKDVLPVLYCDSHHIIDVVQHLGVQTFHLKIVREAFRSVGAQFDNLSGVKCLIEAFLLRIGWVFEAWASYAYKRPSMGWVLERWMSYECRLPSYAGTTGRDRF